MKEISGINSPGGFGNIQPRLPKGAQGQAQHAQNPKHPSELHIGDIVQARVIELISTDRAMLELPSGTMEALVGEHLHPGDELFFQVRFLEPLALSPFAVHARIASSGRTKDILRMLSLPDTAIHEEVVNVLKNAGGMLSRDEIAKIALASSKLAESAMPQAFLTEFSQAEIIRIFVAMQQHGIPLYPASFRRVADSLRDTKRMEANFLEHFQKLVENLPEELAGRLKTLLERYGAGQAQIGEAMSFFAMENEDSFYAMLNEVLSWTKDGAMRQAHSANIAAAERIMLMLEAQQIVNLYAAQHAAQMYYVVPLLHEGRLRLLQFILRRRAGGKNSPSLVEFLLRLETEGHGELAVSGSLHTVRLIAKLFSPAEEFAAALKTRLSDLRETLEKNYFYVQSLTVNEHPDETVPPPGPQSFEYVV